MKPRYLRMAAVALTGSLLSACATAPDWYEYKSDNFTVYSDVSEGRADTLIRRLERFRRAALTVTGLEDAPEKQKLRVFHFNSSSEFRNFSGDGKIAGFYHSTWGGPVIFSHQRGHGLPASGLMFHEYVHHLMRERSPRNWPRWYSEGFAELLASAKLKRDTVLIGSIPDWRLGAWDRSLDLPLDLDELLETGGEPDIERDSLRYWNDFYATAWLFTHYLQVGQLYGESDYQSASGRYVKAVADGDDPLIVFPEHFGVSVAEMQSRLRHYGRHLYGIDLPVPEHTAPISRRSLEHNEHLFLLADHARALGDETLAMKYLARSQPGQPGWDKSRVTMAILRGHQGDFDAGTELLADIDERGPVTHGIATQLAHLYLDRLQAAVEEGRWSEADCLAAVKYGQMAVELNPGHLPAYRLLWQAYQQKGDTLNAVKTMMRAFQQDPAHVDLNSEIGFYLAELGKPKLAEPFLNRVLAWSHSAKVRDRAEAVLQGLESSGSESALVATSD